MIGFIRFGKDLQIIQSHTQTAILDIPTFTYRPYSLSYSDKNVEYLPLPNFENIRQSYNVGDEIYYVNLSMLRYSTIKEIYGNGYYRTSLNRKLHFTELLPYNWYILHAKCRLAIEAWLFCARKMNIYKDLRKLIAVYIWKLRNEYEWECDHKHSKKRAVHKKIKSYF